MIDNKNHNNHNNNNNHDNDDAHHHRHSRGGSSSSSNREDYEEGSLVIRERSTGRSRKRKLCLNTNIIIMHIYLQSC